MMHHAERSDERLEELLANHAAVHFVLYSTASLQHKVNQKALHIWSLVDHIQEFGGTMPSTLHSGIQDIYHTESGSTTLSAWIDDTERMDRLMHLAVLRDSSDEGDAQPSQRWATLASS